MGNIQIELQDTINKANQLEEIGNEIQNLSKQDFSQIGTAIATVWKGDASNHFQKKFNQYNTTVEKRGQEVNRIARDLQNSVKRLQQVETFAKSLWG